jgi:hypothetical protein
MKRKIIFLSIALLVGLTIGVTLTAKLNLFSPVHSQEVAVPSLEGFRMEDAIINVANATGRAVVSISTEHTEKIKGGRKLSVLLLAHRRLEKRIRSVNTLKTFLVSHPIENTNRGV